MTLKTRVLLVFPVVVKRLKQMKLLWVGLKLKEVSLAGLLNSKTSHGKKCKGDNTVLNNARKAGFTPPSMFKMRKSSPYVMSPITNKDI